MSSSAWREASKVLSSVQLVARLFAAGRTSSARLTVGDQVASQRDAANHLLEFATSRALHHNPLAIFGASTPVRTAPAARDAPAATPAATREPATRAAVDAAPPVHRPESAESGSVSRSEALSHVLNFGQLATARAAESLAGRASKPRIARPTRRGPSSARWRPWARACDAPESASGRARSSRDRPSDIEVIPHRLRAGAVPRQRMAKCIAKWRKRIKGHFPNRSSNSKTRRHRSATLIARARAPTSPIWPRFVSACCNRPSSSSPRARRPL